MFASIVHWDLSSSVVYSSSCAVQRPDQTSALYSYKGVPNKFCPCSTPMVPKELNLLRRTPTGDLTRIFALRAETMALRIQRFWRQYGGHTSLRGGVREISTAKYVRHSPIGSKDRLPNVDSKRQTITAPKIKSCRRYGRPIACLVVVSLLCCKRSCMSRYSNAQSPSRSTDFFINDFHVHHLQPLFRQRSFSSIEHDAGSPPTAGRNSAAS